MSMAGSAGPLSPQQVRPLESSRLQVRLLALNTQYSQPPIACGQERSSSQYPLVFISDLEQEAVLLALPGVGDLPPGRAEAGVPAVVVALLLDEGVAASVRDLAQQTLLHALPGGAAHHAARGPGRAAAEGTNR